MGFSIFKLFKKSKGDLPAGSMGGASSGGTAVFTPDTDTISQPPKNVDLPDLAIRPRKTPAGKETGPPPPPPPIGGPVSPPHAAMEEKKASSPDPIPFDTGDSPTVAVADKEPPTESAPEAPTGRQHKVVTLELGDVWERIPRHYRTDREVFMEAEIKFREEELLPLLKKGRVAMRLSDIASRCSEPLVEDLITEEAEVEITMPLQKIVEQIGEFKLREDQEEPEEPDKEYETAFLQAARSDETPAAAPDEAEKEEPKSEEQAKQPTSDSEGEITVLEIEEPEETTDEQIGAVKEPPTEEQADESPVDEVAEESPEAEVTIPLPIAATPDASEPAAKPEEEPTDDQESAGEAVAEQPQPEEPKEDKLEKTEEAPDEAGPIPFPGTSLAPEALPAEEAPVPPAVEGEQPEEPAEPKPEMISLGLAAILKAIPEDLVTGDVNALGENEKIELPLSLLAAELPKGKVTVPLQALQKGLPDSHQELLSSEMGDVPVTLPLPEVMLNLPPDALKTRDDQEAEPRFEEIETPISELAKQEGSEEVMAPEVHPKEEATEEAVAPPETESAAEPEEEEAAPPPAESHAAAPVEVESPDQPAEPESITAPEETETVASPAEPEAQAAPPAEEAPPAEPAQEASARETAEIAEERSKEQQEAEKEPPPSSPVEEPSDRAEEEEESEPDLSVLQAVLMTNEQLDARKVAELGGKLPGVHALLISSVDGLRLAGTAPAEIDADALSAIAPRFFDRVSDCAKDLNCGEIKSFTIQVAPGFLSFFQHGNICLSVFHKKQDFLPGVRDRFVTVAGELSRLYPTASPRR